MFMLVMLIQGIIVTYKPSSEESFSNKAFFLMTCLPSMEENQFIYYLWNYTPSFVEENLTSLGDKCCEELVKSERWDEARQECDTYRVMVREAKVWLGDNEKLVLTWKQVSEKLT